MERSDCTYGAILNKDVLLLPSLLYLLTCYTCPASMSILDHVLSALHHALFLPVFTNVFYFYTNFISSTPLLRIFYSW